MRRGSRTIRIVAINRSKFRKIRCRITSIFCTWIPDAGLSFGCPRSSVLLCRLGEERLRRRPSSGDARGLPIIQFAGAKAQSCPVSLVLFRSALRGLLSPHIRTAWNYMSTTGGENHQERNPGWEDGGARFSTKCWRRGSRATGLVVVLITRADKSHVRSVGGIADSSSLGCQNSRASISRCMGSFTRHTRSQLV
jgi:hypothetical protein